MKNNRIISLTLFVIISTALSAEVLIISDTFNTANTGLNDDLGTRQSGSIGTQNWSTVTPGATNSSAIAGNALSVGGTNNIYDYSAVLDYDFGGLPSLTSGGSFVIRFDTVLVTTGSYSSFSMASIDSDARPVIDVNTDLGLLFDDDQKTVSPRNKGVALGGTNIGDNSGSVVLTITTSSITQDTAYTIDMTLDGNTVDINGTGAGTSLNSTWTGDSLYLHFSSRADENSTFDNFEVIAVPEPSSLLLTFGGLALLWVGLRRRA